MKKKEISGAFVEKNENRINDFKEYCSSPEYEVFWENMRSKKFTVSDTEVNYRMIHHWATNNLLPDGVIEGGGWRKFTLVELVWIKAIVRMREAGLSLDKIKSAKESLLKLDKKSGSYLLFEFYIAKALSTSDDPYIIIISNGEVHLAAPSEVQFLKILKSHYDVTLISLAAILEDLGHKVVGMHFLDYLNAEEQETLSELRSEENKKVSVRLNKGKIFEIESTKVFQNPQSYLDVQKEIKNNRMYGKVVFQAEDGETKSLEVTKKKRFK
ncbi:MAG: hypothetical protein A2747_02865 [Candidatus Yonathbacteria bacterium RIFCSPHIGHO2_01_FULL_44_41]|uniref:HTH merR-type domain-containing protein n=1 Tax=Candidatus Yonathbacteria bacterium RIFCSPHIGHO2_02_FULL_44_14 TaxID=1802724 RepID=A0A1G2S6D2_9BACT|nr:MAG: hypothetical protein A2747_02865 [Candidatus Yonathbacteria bacterium RIFCSPHIGHO2_01_FULL_44_41]OHA80547.1 MAG: hypothetical protein A3D51_00525 [Candidatus Yonathbacteria bacterium RIFCSPHIGHO2_02_FULL_44_14]OHA82161.1 MAG: hypothetical protein A3B06_01470 [Candidatus Yonathbacteria bacterium RIFCSPLOWO2_01_FULL_43_20]